jgi:hypothetical protein
MLQDGWFYLGQGGDYFLALMNMASEASAFM